MSKKKEPLLQVQSSEGPTVPDGSSWPNLFEETFEMLLASIMVYGVVDLRTLARKGLLTSDFHTQQLLDLPISASDIVKLVSENRDALHDEIGQDSTELYLSAFDSLVDPQDSFEVELDPCSGETKILLNSVEIVMVDDENSDTELVYGICVNTAKKQITLIFRGCTTKKDWRVSADPFLTEQKICLDGTDEKAMNISIHRGFYNYLCHPSPTSSATGTLQKNKFERICDNLQRLLENRVYRHVGMVLHLYKNERYKMKHTRGSSSNFWLRLAQDWKRLWKQSLQRLVTVPFVL